MTPDPVPMAVYHECDGVVRVASGFALPIEGVDDIYPSFQSVFEEIDLQLPKVAFVSLLSNNFMSLKVLARCQSFMSRR